MITQIIQTHSGTCVTLRDNAGKKGVVPVVMWALLDTGVVTGMIVVGGQLMLLTDLEDGEVIGYTGGNNA